MVSLVDHGLWTDYETPVRSSEDAAIYLGQATEGSLPKTKKALKTAPALRLPDLSKDFQLFVHERLRLALGVLTQRLGSWKRLVGYFSKQLDNISAGWPPCLRAVAATVMLIQEARKLTMGRHIDVYVPHMVTTVLEQKGGPLAISKQDDKNPGSPD